MVTAIVPQMARFPVIFFMVIVEPVDGPVYWVTYLVVDLVEERGEKGWAGGDVFPFHLCQDSFRGFCGESIDGSGDLVLIWETVQIEEASDYDDAVLEAIGQEVVHGCSEAIFSAIVTA
jgi:hypothetical protein